MTQLLFYAAFSAGLGFLSGKVVKGLNPFYIFFGGIIIFIPSAQFLIGLDSYFYTSAFVVGFSYNYGNPFRRLLEAFEELKMGWLYRRATANASDKLSSQKEEIEAEIHRQKQTAEEQLREKERQVEENLKRQKEELRRERERFKKEQQKQKNQSRTHNQSSETKSDSRSYMEILGVGSGYTKEDLKTAYRKQCARLHPDKWQDRPAHIKKAMEEEQKLVNEAYKSLNDKY